MNEKELLIAASILIIVIAKSGRGKTTALRNCDPETTAIINVMGKTLPFMKASQYVLDKNLFHLADSPSIVKKMQEISKEEKIENLIIDDGQYIMATEFVKMALIKGFDKWNIMAKNIWKILVEASQLRSGLKIYFLTHEDDSTEDRKMKTLGKLLAEKLTPEGLASIVVYGELESKDKKNKYYFSTQSDGTTNAKSPMGMFPYDIPNDIDLMSKRINEYYKGIELKDSKLDFTIK